MFYSIKVSLYIILELKRSI